MKKQLAPPARPVELLCCTNLFSTRPCEGFLIDQNGRVPRVTPPDKVLAVLPAVPVHTNIMSKLSLSPVLGSILPTNRDVHVGGWRLFATASTGMILLGIFLTVVMVSKMARNHVNTVVGFGRFIYATFLKSHAEHGTEAGQQGALENFYKIQVYRPPRLPDRS